MLSSRWPDTVEDRQSLTQYRGIGPHLALINIGMPRRHCVLLSAPQGVSGLGMSFLVIFTLGYLIGGVSALLILGLTVAARRSERAEHYHATAKRRG